VSEIGHNLMKLDIKSQNLQDFILKRLGSMRNIKSSEGAGKAHPLQKEQTTKRGGDGDIPFGQVHLAQSGTHVGTTMVGHHGNVGC
jgi:hypothetical protein